MVVPPGTDFRAAVKPIFSPLRTQPARALEDIKPYIQCAQLDRTEVARAWGEQDSSTPLTVSVGTNPVRAGGRYGWLLERHGAGPADSRVTFAFVVQCIYGSGRLHAPLHVVLRPILGVLAANMRTTTP